MTTMAGDVNQAIVTREAMVEYLSLQRWSRRSCLIMPLTLALWITLMAVVAYRSHTETSYRVREAITNHLVNLTAELSKGVAPQQLPREVADTGSSSRCTCACAPTGFDVCMTGDRTVASFNGSITQERLKHFRARAAYFTSTPSTESLQWEQLRTQADVWFWLQHGLIPELWHEEPSTSPLDTTKMFGYDATLGDPPTPPGRVLAWNQVVGGVRFRQRRAQERECGGEPHISAPNGERCHDTEPSTRPFSIGALEGGYYAEGFMPDPSERGAFDVYFNIQSPTHEVLETLEHMLKAHNWLDPATDELRVQAAFLNAEAHPPLYGVLEVRFVFDRSGGLQHSISVRTTLAEEYPDAIFVALDITWIVLVFVLFSQNLLRLFLRFLLPSSDEQSPCSFWSAWDWVTIVVSLAIFGGRVLIALDASQVAERMAQVPSSPPDFGESEERVEAYHRSWGDVLDNIIHLLLWTDYYRVALFVYTIVLTVQIFKVLRGQPKLAQLASVLFHAVEDLIHYVAVFLVLFLSFAFSGFMIFGMVLEEWSRPSKAINSSFRSLLGDTNLPAMYEYAPVSTVAWYGLFLSVMIFLMLNLLVAITYDNYTIIKGKCGQSIGIFSQMRLLWRDVRNRGYCRCRRNPSFPAHSELLEELMLRSELLPEERWAVHQSVLGAKWHRLERKRHAFSQGEDAGDQAVHAPVARDLKQMQVDQDYAESLMEECSEQLRRDGGYEDARVAQLRELVLMAEGDLAAMRTRLTNCQGTAKSVMYELTSRLEVLERMVHSTLGDLVVIATAAGVPDCKPGTTPQQRAKLDSTVSSLRSLTPAARSAGMLTGSMSRVLQQLTSGERRGSADRPSSPGEGGVHDWHRAMRSIDGRSKRLTTRPPVSPVPPAT